MIALATRCHHCGTHLALDDGFRGYAVSCPQCLDPSDDGPIPSRLQGKGSTPEDALQHWFDRREQLGLEPEARLSALATFIVPRSPEGWGFTIPDTFTEHTETTDDLTYAEGYAALCTGSAARTRIPHNASNGVLPIYYGPAKAQKAANDR
jgi:hypothetical protein